MNKPRIAEDNTGAEREPHCPRSAFTCNSAYRLPLMHNGKECDSDFLLSVAKEAARH
jgi:hypothetical protein